MRASNRSREPIKATRPKNSNHPRSLYQHKQRHSIACYITQLVKSKESSASATYIKWVMKLQDIDSKFSQTTKIQTVKCKRCLVSGLTSRRQVRCDKFTTNTSAFYLLLFKRWYSVQGGSLEHTKHFQSTHFPTAYCN